MVNKKGLSRYPTYFGGRAQCVLQRRSQTYAFLLISNFFSHVFPHYGGAYMCLPRVITGSLKVCYFPFKFSLYEYGHRPVSQFAVYIKIPLSALLRIHEYVCSDH